MDSLSYIYLNKANGYHKNTNKLAAVKDRGNNSDPTAYNDFKGSHYFSSDTTSLNNYQYDAIGNLIEDKEEGISDIEWTVYGKVKRVEKTNGDIIEFDYDPAGNRIRKATPLSTTHYVRDASGNMMATYKETPTNDSLRWQSAMLYGSSRLGTYEADTLLFPSTVSLAKHHTFLGKKRFELSNHLGNVLVTVSDRKIGVDDGSGQVVHYEAEVLSASDYYPFGFSMPGRSFDQEKYRFGFNGKENDSEWGSQVIQDYGFRIYNPSIGKFLSVDPLAPSYPWYTPYQFAGNKPIQAIDLDGLEEKIQIVQKNQTLSQIAKENNTTVEYLAKINGIEYIHHIGIGQELIINPGYVWDYSTQTPDSPLESGNHATSSNSNNGNSYSSSVVVTPEKINARISSMSAGIDALGGVGVTGNTIEVGEKEAAKAGIFPVTVNIESFDRQVSTTPGIDFVIPQEGRLKFNGIINYNLIETLEKTPVNNLSIQGSAAIFTATYTSIEGYRYDGVNFNSITGDLFPIAPGIGVSLFPVDISYSNSQNAIIYEERFLDSREDTLHFLNNQKNNLHSRLDSIRKKMQNDGSNEKNGG